MKTVTMSETVLKFILFVMLDNRVPLQKFGAFYKIVENLHNKVI
jgi:hypothetical protein